MNHLLFWVLFNIFVLAMLALDLGLLNRPGHTVTFREALAWSAVWITLAAAFAVLIYFWRGHTATLEFVTGYVLELSLSVDNLFVFLLLFRYFRVPSEYQHKVLFWGILGALVMRGIFIVAGVRLLGKFHWIVYVFGALLVYSGIQLFRQEEAEVHPGEESRAAPAAPLDAGDGELRRREVFRAAGSALCHSVAGRAGGGRDHRFVIRG